MVEDGVAMMEQINWEKYMERARIGLASINFLVILLYISIILLGTRYVIDAQIGKEFLSGMSRIPSSPILLYWTTLGMYGILVGSMHVWKEGSHPMASTICPVLEIIMCLMIVSNMSMVYNGVILLVFSDILYHKRKEKHGYLILTLLAMSFFLCNYDFVSTFLPMTDISQYFDVFPSNSHVIIQMVRSVLETSNMTIFIVFLLCYIANQLQEKENIQKELDMIQNVNQQLQNYAEISEKLGETNERKRLAREIHDTLGHALTGIAAGVDACIAMIDRNPEATKKQLFVISRVVRQGIGDVRNSLNKLRPGALEEQGFKGSVENMVHELNSLGNISVRLEYELENVDLEKTKEDALFRMIQESTTNSIRHGHARNVNVHLFTQEHMLCLEIQDDGVGCDTIKYGYGLKQMNERVSILGGMVEFNGENGFLTKIRIPLQKGEIHDQSINS